MRSPQEVAEGIRAVFANFSQNWIIVIEAVFLFLLIYFVLKTLFENNAKKLIPVYVFLLICTGVVALFSEHVTVVVFYVFIMLIVALLPAPVQRGDQGAASGTSTESASFPSRGRRRPSTTPSPRARTNTFRASSRRCRISPRTTRARSSCSPTATCPRRSSTAASRSTPISPISSSRALHSQGAPA